MKSTRNQILFFALVLVAAALVAGCGGGGSSSSGGGGAAASGGSGSASSSSPTESTSTSAGSGDESVEAAVRTEDPVSEGAAATTIEPIKGAMGQDNDEIQPTGAKPVKPCKLVTRSEASAILGKGTTVAERPQGPTCVYSNAGRTVTLVVEVASVKRLSQGAREATKVNVGGKTGWCIKYQATAVIVGIGDGRVLRANGTCQAAVRFVSKALPRI
jgi:hypothetical protein